MGFCRRHVRKNPPKTSLDLVQTSENGKIGFMISIVVPVFDEEQSLKPFFKELTSSLKGKTYEVIFIDDGSHDQSLNILKDFEKKSRNVRVFSFRKNQGKAEALTLAFQKAKGEYVVTLDADLQDKPSEIDKLLKKANEGWDLVAGWRKNRKDPKGKIVSSKFFNSLAGFFWGLNLHDYNCGLKVYRTEAAKSLNLYGGLHRFIPLLIFQQGFRVTEVPVSHDFRRFGKSKYGFSKLWNDLPDIFTMLFLSKYSQRPLHFFGTVGGILATIGTIILVYLSILRFQGQTIGDRPLLLFGILLVLIGIQIFFTGFLADLILHLSNKNGNDTKWVLRYQTK